MQVEYQSRLQALLSRSENNTCVDCNASNPTWATLIKNRKLDDAASTLLGGAFACANCIGAHRKLGTHIVFAKSVSLDRWNINEIEAMELHISQFIISGSKRRTTFETHPPAIQGAA